MLMEFEQQLAQMEQHAEAVRILVHGLSDEWARWKPDPESWSILEVVCHLCDEERLDFRPRLDITLHRPDETWAPIDPQGWVTQREYNRRDLAQMAEEFLAERGKSIAWLKALSAPDWNASYQAPFGEIRAGDLLASWAAHDLLHLRQLVELHWAGQLEMAQPFGVRYAGDWQL
jgi:hypothetical protein